MANYIDAEKIIKDLYAMRKVYDAIAIPAMIKALEEHAAADVAPVVHGRWKIVDGHAYCTHCKREMGHDLYGYAHCPICGAKMDAEE